jgi:haloalkane dehalogenase
MNVLRTPDERFDGLAGFDFAPNYVEVPSDADAADAAALRVH